MFKTEGNHNVTILDTIVAEPRFATGDPNAFDIVLKLRNEEGDEDYWRGECSMNMGKGNFAGKTQMQITLETLGKIGLRNGDLTNLGELVGIQTVAWVKATEKDGKTYYNVRAIGVSDMEPTKLSAEEAGRRYRALMNPQAAPAFAPPPTQQTASAPINFGTTTAAPNPFGVK
jgi:hypothetical protein